MRKLSFYFIVIFLLALTAPCPLRSQGKSAAQKSRRSFPYLFSNFPWWSDADLRINLKHRIPGLGDELTEDSKTEAKVRTVLTQLLREKGIDARVMTEEPSENLLSAPHDPNAPPTSIIFSILAPPEIDVETLTFVNAPVEAAESLNQIASRIQGRPYSGNGLWVYREDMQQELRQIGYLDSRIALKPALPKKQESRYFVPITATVTAGPRYHIATITADGGPLLKGRDLSPYFALKPGDVATQNPFGMRLIGTLRTIYWQAGYPDVQLHAPPILDAQRALVSYHLEVIPGPLYHLHTIKIEGLSAAEESQAIKALGFKPGDTYNAYAAAMLSRKMSTADSPLKNYDVSFTPREDKQKHEVDLTLNFYKK